MSNAPTFPTTAPVVPGIYVDEIDAGAPDIPAITRELVRASLEQICERELARLVYGGEYAQDPSPAHGELARASCDALGEKFAQRTVCTGSLLPPMRSHHYDADRPRQRVPDL